MPINTFGAARTFGVTAVAALLGLGTAGPATAQQSHGASRSAATASVANDTLTITGSDGPDTITVGLDTDPNTLIVDFGAGNTQRFDRNTFSAIAVFLHDGDDVFTENTPSPDEAVSVDGGNGDDSIVTGTGNDVIFGGDGNDKIQSGAGDDIIDAGRGDDSVTGAQGRDTASLGSGDDSFVWNPGDGNDFVDGERGYDDLVFNGSGAPEKMSLSANDHRAVFLRDVGAIRMDLDGIEALDLTPLGGADSVTVNDMSGTDFQQANIDLSVAGAIDPAADSVTVNGTNDSDHVHVEEEHGAVEVEKLQTKTRITGSEPTADHLQVNTLDGNDKVRVDDAVSSLIGLGIDLGPGQH